MHGQCQGLAIGRVPLAETGPGDFWGSSPPQIARDFLRFFAGLRDVSNAEVVSTIRPLSELLFGRSVGI